ncbi:MAG: putative transposase [Streptosporangiaceae bacterium]
MAVRLVQLPLPWLPEDAVQIAPGIGVVLDADGSGTVWIHGMAAYWWAAGDWAGRKLAAVQLAELTGADKKDIAAAFGTDAATFWRWRTAYAGDGLAGLLPGKRGPKGPSKLTPQVREQIRELAADGGLSQAEIGRRCGVSGFAVRTVLGRTSTAATAKAAGQPHAGHAQDTQAQDTLPGLDEPGQPDQDQGVLPVLPDPVPRDGERVLARFGLLGEGAAPVFTPGARIPLAGLLLALPALAQTGLLATARAVYRRLRDGFYGLDTVLVALVFLALLREPRAEGATRVPPAALGRILGLDRAPEVKTIRRKAGELAAAGRAADWQLVIAAHHAAAADPDDLGFLYIDGHTRAYFGTRDIQKTHVARLKFPAPATEETWVTDGRGGPMLVVIGEPSQSLAARVKDLLPDLRKACPPGAAPVLCFDRGGWSPDVFAEITAAGFGLLTYRKNDPGKDIPPVAGEEFTTMAWRGDDGRDRQYEAADGTAAVTITAGPRKGEVLTLRQVTRLDKGRQIHILTTIGAGELPPAGVIYRMGGRWREENWFRYGRAHYALDSLDSYAAAPDNPDRTVPNPAKKQAAAQVAAARKALAAAETARERKLTEFRSPAPGQETIITNTMLARLDKPAEVARRALAQAQAAGKQVPAKIPLSQHNPAMLRLDTETKLITHAIKMAAFNTETTLARALHGNYARAEDEAYALIREALTTSGDIIPDGQTLTIRLDPLSAPRRTRAIAAICDQLNATRTTYPGTQLILRYEIKNHPGAAA